MGDENRYCGWLKVGAGAGFGTSFGCEGGWLEGLVGADEDESGMFEGCLEVAGGFFSFVAVPMHLRISSWHFKAASMTALSVLSSSSSCDVYEVV